MATLFIVLAGVMQRCLTVPPARRSFKYSSRLAERRYLGCAAVAQVYRGLWPFWREGVMRRHGRTLRSPWRRDGALATRARSLVADIAAISLR